ncbi:N-methylglutamate dehydrogenase subunit D [Ancylobacter aquaticus]|uniref:N-methylglutamate dehydrogenase subunit D n=1 Tax=Ancylobacter aquaticus TaxID=100 RepID=A0A4R1I9Z2_ANCAQ|nr:sarcosine oxidase subunit gamma family protein [Ancylobacter aquaticus]TCK31063.1 N-methylglutamate dehydrogenase subunit D [Ancylobacter aquaticus]
MADHSSHDPLAGLRFDRVPPSGTYGADGEPGVTVTIPETPFIALVVARNGFAESVTGRLGRAFGLEVADRTGAAIGAAATVVGTGPGRFLVLSKTEPDLAGTLRALLGSEAAVSEQDDAYVTFDLAGEKTPDLLAKGALIDIDPRVFLPGDAATTVIAHIGVTLWRVDEATWRLLVARSLEASFTRFLIASGAAFGLRLENGTAGRG